MGTAPSTIRQHSPWFIGSQIVLSLLGYGLITYLLSREDFISYLLAYSVLFLAFYFLYLTLDWKNGWRLAILFRVFVVFSIPVLSDDYIRFLWDGRLWVEGINPYLYTPQYVHNQLDVSGLKNWYKTMNSPHYFTVYPPFNQYLFALSGFHSDTWTAVLLLKIPLLLSEIGTLWILPKLLKSYGIPLRNALLYALNPLVILEVCGNVHYEGVMVFLLLSSLYLLRLKKDLPAALLFGLSVSTKLIPLLFLPLLIRWLGWKRFLIFSSLAGLTFALSFLPFLSQELLFNLGDSLDLYFRSFSFNGFYYSLLVWLTPDSWNAVIGFTLMLFPILFLIKLSTSREPSLLPEKMTWLQSLFYFFSAVVHPWYLVTPLAMNVFRPTRFVLIWSFLIGLSYFTYRSLPYKESMLLLTVEYLLVFGFLLFDRLKPLSQSGNKYL